MYMNSSQTDLYFQSRKMKKRKERKNFMVDLFLVENTLYLLYLRFQSHTRKIIIITKYLI